MSKKTASVLASLMVLAMVGSALAQAPGGGGRGGGGGGPGTRGPQLTEAQKLVNDLPVTSRGVGERRSPTPAELPMPSPDPRNLEGVWIHGQDLVIRSTTDMYGWKIPYTMAAAKVIERRVNAKLKGTPYKNQSTWCLPPGQAYQLDLHFPFYIFQTEHSIEFLFDEYHGRWRIALDPKYHPDKKQYMGRSIGHWEGNTLVVEVTDFKEDLWLESDGTPISKDAKWTFRIRKVDNGDRQPFLEMISTLDDPKYYTYPWSVVRTFPWAPERAAIREYNCEQQTGDPSGATDSDMLIEPKEEP
jgi:hypothetical protein